MSNRSHLCATFVARTQQSPHSPFVIMVNKHEESILTNSRMLNRALDIGEALQASGLSRGDIVIIVLEHRSDLYAVFLGCMIYGYVPAFMPPLTVKQDSTIYRRSMSLLFARIDPAAVVISAATQTSVPKGGYATVSVDAISDCTRTDPVSIANTAMRALPPDSELTAFLQHSSGTTGLKKGVVLSHRAVLEHIRLYATSIGVEPGDVFASWLPLYHDMGLITSFLLPMVIGNPIVSLDALEWVTRPTLLLDAMDRHRAAFTWLPNFAFHHVLRAVRHSQRWDLTATKGIINCSEPCRASTFELFAERFATMGIAYAKLGVSYAMAENVFAVTQTPLGQRTRVGCSDRTRSFLSSGRPIPGVDIQIQAPNGVEMATGQPGEICIRSSTIFDGYFRQSDITAQRWRDGWFHTNDLGCIESDELFVLGRVDDLLIVNGKNLFAHEIEDLLSAVPGVAPGRTLACTEFDSKLGATRLLILAEAMVEGADTKSMEAQIRKITLAQTGIFPNAVQFLPRGFLVKSSSGKIARWDTYRKYQEFSGAWIGADRPPEN